MFFYWTLCANGSQLLRKIAWHSSTSYPRHLGLEFLVGHVLVGGIWGNNSKLLPQIPKLPQKIKNNDFEIFELNWVGIWPLFWFKVTFCHRWFEWMFDNKTNPNLIYKLLPLKTTIDIPHTISFIAKLQILKFGLWVVTSSMNTSIRLDLYFFFKKNFRFFSYGCRN